MLSKTLLFGVLSAFVALVSADGASQNAAGCGPADNSSVTFCCGLAPGFYCNPADALNVVQCPGGQLTPCPAYRFCARVGRVEPCYQCESGFNVAKFCDYRGAGTFCAPKLAGNNGVWSCPDGKEIPCAYGSSCAQIAPNAAICLKWGLLGGVKDGQDVDQAELNQAIQDAEQYPYQYDCSAPPPVCGCPCPIASVSCCSGPFEETTTTVEVLDVLWTKTIVSPAFTATTTITQNSTALSVSTTQTATVTTTFFPTVTVGTTTTFVSVSSSFFESTDPVTVTITTGAYFPIICTSTFVGTSNADTQTTCVGASTVAVCQGSSTNNLGTPYCTSFGLPPN